MWVNFDDKTVLETEAITGLRELSGVDGGSICTEIVCGGIRYLVKKPLKEVLIMIANKERVNNGRTKSLR